MKRIVNTLYTLAVITGLLCSSNANAQNSSTTNVRNYNVKNSQWTELNLQGVISKKFNWQLDVQYRRQSDQVGAKQDPNLTNIVKNAYQTVFRPFIHYFPLESRKLRLSLSPIGWWATFGNGNDSYNGAVKNSSENYTSDVDANLMYPELRTTFQLTAFDQMGRVKMSYRARYELRWIGNGEASAHSSNSGWDIFNSTLHHNTFKTRLRLMIRADIALKGPTIDEKEFYVAASNEIMLGMTNKTGEGSILDQNRAYLGVGYKFPKDIRVELGYLNQINPKEPKYNAATNVSTSQVDLNNIVHLFIIFDNFNRLFEKKKEPPVKE